MIHDYEFYLRGKYDPEVQAILDAFRVKLDSQNNMPPIDIGAMVSGKISDDSGYNLKVTEVTEENVDFYAKRYNAVNPLFNDSEYAKKAGFKDKMAIPLFLSPGYMPAMPHGIGDYMVVTGHNDTMNMYKPIYVGDKLYTVIINQDFEDITPVAGSFYRTFAVSGWAKTYNQNGELVAEGANIIKESFRRHKNPSERNPDGLKAWESPDWWTQRPAYIYSEADWDYIKSVWKSEKLRGSEPLYWDDVNVGDMPPVTISGPIVLDTVENMVFHIPQFAEDLKHDIFDPEKSDRLVKNEQGIYVLEEHMEIKPTPPPPYKVAPTMTPEIANRDGRCVIMNAIAAQWAAAGISNWIGDKGWIERIGWNIMSTPPGYDATVIPHIEKRPDLFDKFPYFAKVPFLQGKRADCHALQGDISINKSYIYDKYEKNGDFYIDLIWWAETIDKYYIEEGFATVRLPKK